MRYVALFGSSLVAALAFSGCSGSSTTSGFGDGTGNGNGNGGGGGGGLDDAGNFGGPGDSGKPAVCTPNPGNFDIPANNCDDDGDGKVDNVAACDTGLQLTGPAAEFARSMGLCSTATANDTKWGVVSATYTHGHAGSGNPVDGQHGILSKFGNVIKPREGAAFGLLSSGWAREWDNSGGNPSDPFKGGVDMGNSLVPIANGAPPGFPKPAQGCPGKQDIYDAIAVKLDIKVPNNAQGFTFDFDFYSGEWPEYVCTEFNDAFVAWLHSKALNGGAADNISFDANKNPVSVNNGFFDRCTANTQTGCAGLTPVLKTATCPGGTSELGGTGFLAESNYCGTGTSSGGGATGWLTTTAPVSPGEVISIEFIIWDTGDGNYDSSVLLDNFTWVPGPVQTGTQRPPR